RKLRIDLLDVADLAERRQLVERFQVEVVEERLRRAEERRLAGQVAVTDDAHPFAFFERLDDARRDADAADLLDLGARDRLAIRDQRERFEQRAGVARLPLGPQARDER